MNKEPGETLSIQTELSRDLGLTTALSIGVGTMIAAGIFTLSGLAVREVGSSAIVSFLPAAFVAAFTALTYCEFSSIYPESGEGYLYVRKTFPGPPGESDTVIGGIPVDCFERRTILSDRVTSSLCR